MAGHPLIEAYRAGLTHRLPADVVDELADGLTETWQHHLTAGSPPESAARAAIAEFGALDQVVDAFVTQSFGRRIARLLLSTGPVVGACWGAGLVSARPSGWPLPALAAIPLGVALLVVVGTLMVAATSRHNYYRARLGIVGGLGLIVLDLVLLTVIVVATPTPAWPLLAGTAASLARIGLVLRSLPVNLIRL